MVMQKIALLFIIINNVVSQPSNINIFVSIQNHYQSFFSYLPFIDTCYYNQSLTNSGSVTLEEIGPLQFFNKITYEQELTFWGVVYNGFEIAALIQENLQGYQGYILYDSKIQNFDRQLIFFNISQNGLNFSYVLPTINLQTLQIIITINKTIQVELTQQAQQILTNCTNNTWSNFAFLGNQTFLYVCGSSKQGFTFIPDANQSYIQNYDLSQMGVVGDNYKVITNPELYDLVYKENQFKYILWSALLLTQNGSQYQLYFIDYNISNNNLTISSMAQRKLEQTLIIDRIWGFQQKSQVSKWMDVYSSLNISSDIIFPGEIISVFVSSHNNIFIECAAQNGLNYLIVYDGDGNLYWNYSFVGSIIYYGSEVTFIYNKNVQSLFSASVQRPYFVLNSSLFLQNETNPGLFSTYPLIIPCEYVNIFVNYTIFWSAYDYPIYFVQSLDNSPLISFDSIYAVQSATRFLIVGPGFTIKPNSPPNINVQIIDSSTIVINDRTIGILNIQSYSSGGFGIIIASVTSIYVVGLNNNAKVLAYHPCGFNNITSGQLVGKNQYQLTNQRNITCICTNNFENCSIITNAPNIINEPSINVVAISSGQGQSILTIPVKKNLYQIVNQGILGTILQNNSFLIIDMQTRNVLDMVTMNCSPNSTNGLIFTRQFYPPFLVLFCQGSSNISQFVISNNTIIFKRIVPIFGFKTRTGLESIRNAFIYVLIQVDIDNTNQQLYPFSTECCVLKLNFRLFTASVLEQIIPARTLVATSFYKNYDIALVQTRRDNSYESIVKIYFLNQWITFNYTNFNEIITQNTIIPLSFWSPFYNFGSFYNFNISFNLTEASINLTFNKSKNINEDSMIELIPSGQNEMYSGIIAYNLTNYVCGPIFDSLFTRSSTSGDTIIIQDNILTSFKMIGQPGLQFIQIINPQVWGQGDYFSLNNILLLVTVDSMYAYAKIINDIQLVNISKFILPQRSCTYSLYRILNSTAVTLNSDCYGIDFTFDTPLVTINYNPQTNEFTHSSVFIQVSLALTRLETIPFDQITYLIAMIEGPMNAQTGRLVICENLTNLTCTPLFVSTKFQFLIDYSTYITETGLYFVMTIDPKTIQVFIEPKITNSSNLIPANYTFNYSDVINQLYCSTIRVLNVTGDNSYVILSCNAFYYIVIMNFTDNIVYIAQKFARYSQCDIYDTVKPEIISLQGEGLQVLITQCRQNDFTLQLNLYDRTLNQPVTIYTGYLQIFMMVGPRGPNCTTDSISPIRVIPVSTSNNNPLFVAYRMNNVHKFIYAELQGILIDNFLTLQPQIKVIFKPKTIYYKLPTINFEVFNEFTTKTQLIQTKQKPKSFTEGILNYLAFIVFVLANLVTLLFIISYYILRQINNLNQDEQQQLNDLKFEDYDTKPYQKSRTRRQLNKSMRESYQIQLFFIKPLSQQKPEDSIDQSMITQ